MKNNDAILAAYKKVMEQGDWYETRSLSWRKRLRRHPVLTIWYAIIDRFWKILIALRLHGSFLKARTFWGDPMHVTFPDYRSIYHHGLIDGRELPVEHFVVRSLKEGDVCLDVGANVGFYTLLFSALVGDTGSVYAFEPTPRTFNILVKNSSSKKNVMRINAALMEAEGKRNLADYGIEKSGLNTIVPVPHNSAQPNMLSVEVTTLDAYCLAHHICPTLIKIDTEGAEEMVLTGGRNTLSKYHPVLIVDVQRKASQGVVTLLTSLGYRAYQFVGYTPVPYAVGEVLACPNLLFMQADTRNITP